MQNDFFIVDFEGEPSRPLAARRAKSSPLRDVAGMIRSFDYAAVAAVRQLAETRPAAEPRMVQLAESWRQRAVDGFRAAYRKTMRGCAAYPASKKQAREMTAFFMLEKAVYEVSYELANRPSWVDIPLEGILGILNKAKGGGRWRSALILVSTRARSPQCARSRRVPNRSALSRSAQTLRCEAILEARHGDPFALSRNAQDLRRDVRAGDAAGGGEDGGRRQRDRRKSQPRAGGFIPMASSSPKSPVGRSRSAIGCGCRAAAVTHEFDDIYRFPPVLGELDRLSARRGQSPSELSKARRASDRP